MYDTNQNIPNEYKPLSAWGYVGYNLLFSIPIIGFIFLVVFALDSSNINRRNYARSFFCWILICIILSVIVFAIFMAMGISIYSLNSSGS